MTRRLMLRTPRVLLVPIGKSSARGSALVVLLPVIACASGGGAWQGALEPRFVAVHNALAAIGMAQVGPLLQGTLAEGREARVTLDLPAGCTTIVALGGEGVRDLDATLLDSKGRPVAHDTTGEPQATLRPCLEARDSYVLVVKAASGGGDWVAATWAGGVGGPSPQPAGSAAHALSPPSGACDAPLPIAAGTTRGATSRGESDNTGSCAANSDAREIVYALDVPERQRVTIEVEARFDTVLYVRKDSCADPEAEVDCNDDAVDNRHSRIERVLEPGRYFVFVDGYSDAGSFRITVSTSTVVSLGDACRQLQRTPPLAAGTPVSATTARRADDAHATCGDGAPGADEAYRFDLASRSRVRIVEHSDEMAPVVHVRRACADEQSEAACGDSGAAQGDAAITAVLDPGAYTVFADARERDSTGRYTMGVEVEPLSGTGSAGEGCGDAASLSPSGATIEGDTFGARDDVAPRCAAAGAPDLVYRIDVAKRSRFEASLDREEGEHVLALSKRCGERAAEVACGRSIDEVVPPGTYFVAVDGASPDAFGRFALTWSVRDVTAQTSACAAAPVLAEGRVAPATTLGAGDKFTVSCAQSDVSPPAGPDRVFRIDLARRSAVRVVVTASFDAAVSLRKSCTDVSGGAGAAEIACEGDSDASRRTIVEHVLEAGTYWIVVDGQSAMASDQGPFSIEWRAVR